MSPGDGAGGERLLLVGCGKMGGALLTSWLAEGVAPETITIVEPNVEAMAGFSESSVRHLTHSDSLASDYRPDLVLLAIKPQTMTQVLPIYRGFASAGAVFLSIAAGTTIANLEAHLGAETAVVRAMPNTPAAVGRGMSVLSANAHASEHQRTLCERLLWAVGQVAWVDDEALLDAVTGVSGSGPAYVFYMVEALAQAGVKAGLPDSMAMALARQTVTGAGELLHRAAEPAGQLRKNVTSPNGTTQAALEVLMADDGLAPLMEQAVEAAARRSRELAS
ncbi:MAG: pyrroline-5-carboxylate reductase [Pseudomonadota bacterium]